MSLVFVSLKLHVPIKQLHAPPQFTSLECHFFCDASVEDALFVGCTCLDVFKANLSQTQTL